MKNIIQKDSLLRKKRENKKLIHDLGVNGERFRFVSNINDSFSESNIKVKFDYRLSLRFHKQPKRITSAIIHLSKSVNRKDFERRIKNALVRSVQEKEERKSRKES